jgi:histone H2A
MKEALNGYQVAQTASTFFSAVLEYIVAEVLELSGNAAKDLRKRRISPRELLLGVKGDEELDTLLPAHIARGGVIPHIHRALIMKKSH